MKNLNSQKSNGSELGVQFLKLAKELSKISLDSFGVKIKAVRDESLPYFSILTEEGQVEAIAALKSYINVCQSAVDSSESGSREIRLIWQGIKGLGLRPPGDLFEYITAGDVVEIHSMTGQQIFRNINFFEYCSYTIEDLYCRSWPEIYKHDESELQELMGFAQKVYMGEVKNTTVLEVREHRIVEVDSEESLNIMAKVKVGCPLFDKDGTPVATLVVEEGRLVPGQKMERAPERPIGFRPTIVHSTQDAEI